jgi:5-methyltetrahydrofolate--homocysteine methyltransferase
MLIFSLLLPLSFFTASNNGFLQGLQAFKALSISNVINALLKFAFSIFFVLLGKHLGLKGDVIRALGDKTKRRQLMDQPEWKRILEIEEILETLKRSARDWMTAKAVYQYVPAYSEGDAIIIPREGSEIKWKFRRQRMGDGLCLSDFIGPKGAGDALCVFVTTCGGDIRDRAEKLKSDGEFLKSHALLSLSLETAEAAAEYIHSLIRSQWGFPDHTEMTMMDRFQARYRGKRYSFGYPACPDLEFQQQLFDLLKPADIGVQLTEGFMMSPECSVSALVFSHPEAKYFGVGE